MERRKWLMSAAELELSPSRRDGMSAEEEKKKLQHTNKYVSECGRSLKLPLVAIMTAQTFLNRFYALQSFRTYDRFVTAQACLFLAAKVEESPTKLHKIVTAAHAVRHGDAKTFERGSEGFDEAKNAVLACERAVLYTIDFDVDVAAMSPVSPFSDILARLLRDGIVPADREQRFGQTGIKFIQDSLRTNLCLQFEPKKIASGCALVAVVFLRLYPSDKDKIAGLFKILDISLGTIKAICSQLVHLYLDVDKCDDLIVDLCRHKWIPQALADRRIRARAHQQRNNNNGALVASPSPNHSPHLPSPSPAYSSPLYTPPPAAS